MSDAELMNNIAERVKGQKGIRFTQLANQAQDSGRKALAALLLDLESNAAEQVARQIAHELAYQGVGKTAHCNETLSLATQLRLRGSSVWRILALPCINILC